MSTSNNIDEKILIKQQTEHIPEEETLVTRLSIFIKMRWVAILGIIVVTLMARYVLNVGFPTLPIYIVCVCMVVYNSVLAIQLKELNKLPADMIIPRARRFGYFHIILDMLALTVLLHFTGGMENPFVYLLVFHIVLASIGLNYRMVYLLSTIALILVTMLYSLEAAGIIPHINLEGFVLPVRYKEISRIVAQLFAHWARLDVSGCSAHVRYVHRFTVNLFGKYMTNLFCEYRSDVSKI